MLLLVAESDGTSGGGDIIPVMIGLVAVPPTPIFAGYILGCCCKELISMYCW